MKLVLEAKLRVQGIHRNRETVLFRQDFAERSPANLAETSTVLVRGFRLIQGDMLLALEPMQILTLHKRDGAGTNFSAPGAVARTHHGRHSQKFEFYSTATTASLEHAYRPLSRDSFSIRT